MIAYFRGRLHLTKGRCLIKDSFAKYADGTVCNLPRVGHMINKLSGAITMGGAPVTAGPDRERKADWDYLYSTCKQEVTAEWCSTKTSIWSSFICSLKQAGQFFLTWLCGRVFYFKKLNETKLKRYFQQWVKPQSFMFVLETHTPKPRAWFLENTWKEQLFPSVPNYVEQSTCQRLLHPIFPAAFSHSSNIQHTVMTYILPLSLSNDVRLCNGAHMHTVEHILLQVQL